MTLALVAAGASVIGWLAFGPAEGERGGGVRDAAEADGALTLSLVEAMGGGDDAERYARAFEPRPFVFPADHAAHPDFRTEWWYVTSNLATADGRRFGVHFTIFRNALRPPPESAPDESPGPEEGVGAEEDSGPEEDPGAEWRARDLYMGHFALADATAGRFTEVERFTRGAAGLAGARVEDGRAFRVWIDEWAIESVNPPEPGAAGIFPLRLVAGDPGAGIAIDLVARPMKPVVLQGKDGLSQKGDEPGNASYYYSFTRLRTEGRLVSGSDTFSVSGESWIDREWSTSALDATQAGWDWFALHLDDGRDLMVYRLRGIDGSSDPLSEGILVDPDGSSRRLGVDDFTLEVLERWTSPVDGAVYPSTWRVEVPSADLALRVVPLLRDQEMNVTVRYWEGAVELFDAAPAGRDGRDGARSEGASRAPRVGRGYVELTGYAGRAPPGR
ncbi:MAG: lipocalin-like domain-containing protein [Longimicrobiales bacterium]|nr:lipocalin-like domain-containing protein [Longimicrobiales bacterium]